VIDDTIIKIVINMYFIFFILLGFKVTNKFTNGCSKYHLWRKQM